MASLSISEQFAAFYLLIFFIKISSADSNSTFPFTSSGKASIFGSKITLYGDAEVVNGGYAIQLTGSVSSSAGRAILKKPIKLVEGKPQKSVSFSTNFSFSMSTGYGDGFAFVVVPSRFNLSMFDDSPFGISLGYGKSRLKVAAVKFNVLGDGNVHVGIDIGSSVSARVSNVSNTNFEVASGNKTQAWIDYEAGSNRLEVRLSQFGHSRPADPMLWYPISLSKMWGDYELFVGFSAMNDRNSSQTCFIYSWSFLQRHVPHWIHSQPLDPDALAVKKKDCVKRAFASVTFGVAFGALASFLGLCLWTVFGNRRPVAPEEFAEQSKEFEYEKVKVVDHKYIEDGEH